MADPDRLWSVREDGCLPVDLNTNNVTYNSSLNLVILTSSDQSITVLDAFSGAFLKKSNLSGHKCELLACVHLAEKDKTVYCDGCALGVRGDLQGILLVDTALQTPVEKTEDVVKIELPLVEATQLLKTLSATPLSNKEYVDDFRKALSQGIHNAQDATQGNHKTAKWATVCLQMQHMVIKSVCYSLMEELMKTGQTGQGFPVASAIVDRLGFLLPSSRSEIMKEPVNRALMYSEAARRETFANWPHMNYKWALPEPMAQAGFFHHPNLHGDDRAMCFTCNVCLVCWEPTDEPWSEHERHSQLCPYIKGDYTQNVPLTVTYATQPAQFHGESPQQKIACLSTTFSEDFIATSTRDGNIVVWDLSHILKKHCQFDIDVTNALVALKTGLQIERAESSQSKVASKTEAGEKQDALFDEMQEIPLHDKPKADKQSTNGSHRPSDDLLVTSLCVADNSKWQEDMASHNPSKPSSLSDIQLSLICGMNLRRTKSHQSEEANPHCFTSGSCSGGTSNLSVQLMNEVNEAVSSEPSISRLIDGHYSDTGYFVMPESRFVPYIVILSLVEEIRTSSHTSPSKRKMPSSSQVVKLSTSKDDMVASPSALISDTDDWAAWEDPDCQYMGFTPAPLKNSSPFTSTLVSHSSESKHIKDLSKSNVPNGPSDVCDSLDSSMAEPYSPLKPFTFADAESSASVKLQSLSSYTTSSSDSSANSFINMANANGSLKKEASKISGTVIQCVELPSQFQKEHIEVQSILPSNDKQHVIVILSTKVGYLESSASEFSCADTSSTNRDNASADSYCGGGILVFRLRSENNRIVLEDEPLVTYAVSSPRDVITSTFLLPMEVEDQVEEQRGRTQNSKEADCASTSGHVVATTTSGTIRVLSLAQLICVAEISTGPNEKYLCATYCSGIERLCACTDKGKLQFFDMKAVSDKQVSFSGPDVADRTETNSEGSACKRAKMDDDMVDHPGSELLTNQPLNAENLTHLHSIIQFESLMPRFTAVVPPCWSEIQQEQQQRRHPQHLQQQGESTQHTRTWKLTSDAGQTWDEHLFEILLPKPCTVGHVDVKFSLYPRCTQQPNIEVTLLKQNISSIFCPPSCAGNSDFSQPSSATSGSGTNCTKTSSGAGNIDAEMFNNVVDPRFLEAHNAEILCGPIKLSNCLDLTGSGGLITLASPQLFSCKLRSLLLHIKGFENSPLTGPVLVSKDQADSDRSTMAHMDKVLKSKKKTLSTIYKNMHADSKHKNIKGLFDSVAQAGADKSSVSEKQKLSDLKGCDWFQELSITVRVFKKTNVPSEKMQHNSMIQDSSFHKRLIKLLVTSTAEAGVLGVSVEHLQNMALDILIWILAVKINDPDNKNDDRTLLESLQTELRGMVRSCFIFGSRTTAHKFSRLLALCMECSKLSLDQEVAPAFSRTLVQAFLESFPLLPLSNSSGAMRWFFTLLNRVKFMDIELVAQRSCELLLDVAQQYSLRTNSQHALLKTRYGLSGNPFEEELFDMEVGNLTKPSTQSGSTTPTTIFTNVIKTGSSSTSDGAAASGSKDQPDLFDLLLSPPEKASKSRLTCLRNDIFGLLEVEPLHFRCHATSDGTRMERMDATPNSSAPAPTASAFNTATANLIPLQASTFVDETMSPILGGDLTSILAQSSAPKIPQLDEFLLKKKNLMSHSSKIYGAKMLQFQSYAQQQQHPLQPQLKQSTQQQQPPKAVPEKQLAFPQIQGLLQAPPPQVLVIERMHSGARRFVTLDFGKPVVLTDVIIPSSMDLASLSIDVWIEGEEIDGQRLVVASDIDHRTLVMNNIMPAPVCRYLKITTVGRYNGGTTRSRIPLGSFYGHTYILPWEWPITSLGNIPRNLGSAGSSNTTSTTIEGGCSRNDVSQMSAQTSLLSQLSLFLSLLEDLQCRFSLAKSRLESLLKLVGNSQSLSAHVQYHLKRNSSGKLTEEDAQIMQAYNECLQLQLQLNLAQRAIHRLQISLGICASPSDELADSSTLLAQASTDKLRVILESLLDTVLTSTIGSPSILQPSVSLYSALTPSRSQMLFQHLCLHGTQRIQVSAGLLLVRVCGTQPWWGQFLGNILHDFFHSRYSQVFPQDRVFILLSALGQKSLTGPSALHILDSLLAMLTSVLQPLLVTDSSRGMPHVAAKHLDLSLISWVLLFLCRNMESPTLSVPANTDDAEKGAKKDREACTINNRWSFIESQWSQSTSGGSRGKSHRLARRGGFIRKLTQYKQKTHDIDRFKKIYGSTDKKNQATAKMFLKGMADQSRSGGDAFGRDDDMDIDQHIVLSRDRCLAVVKGLMSLLLSMDFTCHVDLFLVACKVLAKICVACRPSITLAEAMTQEQLEQLVLLVVDTEFNHDSLTWGGPWAGHAITCLLQDILEGEKTCPVSPVDSEADVSDADESAAYLNWLKRDGALLGSEQHRGNKKVQVIQVEQVMFILTSKPEFRVFLHRDFVDGSLCLDEKGNPETLVSLFFSDKDKCRRNRFLEIVTKHQTKSVDSVVGSQPSPPPNLPDFFREVVGYPDMSTFSFGKALDDSFQMIESQIPSATSGSETSVDASKMSPKSFQAGCFKHILNLKNKLTEHLSATTVSGLSHNLSTALDARLEFGLETLPEHRLKVMQSLQMSNIQCAFSSPLPPVPVVCVDREDHSSIYDLGSDVPSAAAETSHRRSEEDQSSVNSVEMLSQCFERMFAQLWTGRVGLESVLQLWLTLNEDQLQNEGGPAGSNAAGSSNVQGFDPTRHPVITLSENAVASLMEVGVMVPCLMIRTWVFLLRSLCLLTNQRHTSCQGTETSLASFVLSNPNLAPLLSKFLSSHSPTGAQQYQVGPAATKIFGDLLYRLQCKAIEGSGKKYKEMLLKIVYNLTAERGAIYQCSGPLDAQVKFLEMVFESPQIAVDLSNGLSVIQAASTVVYQHLSVQDQVVCRTSQDTYLGARSCFGGLVASLLRGSDSRPGGTDSLRDQLMFFLLQLVNKLISAPVSSLPSRADAMSSKVQSSEGSAGSWDSMMCSSPHQAWSENIVKGYSPRLLTKVHLSDDEKSRTRSHQGDPQMHQLDAHTEDVSEALPSPASEIADIVVGNPVIMQNLIQALSYCTSHKLALMFAHTDCLSSLQKTADQTEAVTVGDLIFTILRSLREKCTDRNIMVDNLFHFFAGHPPIMSQVALTRLSEPLLLFTLRMLNSYSAVKKFIDLGGIDIVSSNLVRCNQHMISSSPSIISTLMQNFSSGHGDLADKSRCFETDHTEGLQSFAHLGTITCSGPTASPADGLIQTLANRRARSATWSYHFYPDETSVELTVHLPFAILLKCVHIQPHTTSISTCPSHVSLELSHDGSIVSPASPPLLTSSLTLIRLQLQKPEVVTSVTLLLHRPWDSMTIGLQKISLWGQTAFSESSENSLSLLNEECFSRSSLGWMRILHHCLVSSHEELQSIVAHTAASTPNLLATCTSLLVHPFIGVHASKIETILIKLGLCHNSVGLALFDSILRQSSSHTDLGFVHSYLGKVHGAASPYTVEILYRLGTTQDDNTHYRVEALLRWLEDCSRASVAHAHLLLQQPGTSRSGDSAGLMYNTLSSPSPEHVQCVAAILWYSMDLPVTYHLRRLISVEFIRSMYGWSRVLSDCNLRKAVNNVLCSACHICSTGFVHVQEWMGIVGADGSHIVAPITDESSPDALEKREDISPGMMTDDSKEATKRPLAAQNFYSTDGMTDDSKEAFRLQSLSAMDLDESKLMLLGAVCKSPVAIRQLMNSGLSAMLAQAVCEYCNQQMVVLTVAAMSSDMVAAAGMDNGPRGFTSDMVSETAIDASLVCAILKFFTEFSTEMELKNWLGQAEGNAFWSLLLTLLCSSQYQTPVIMSSTNHDRSLLMSAEERSELETRTVQFFRAVISCHPENQLLFARVLCDVIKDQRTSQTDLLSAMPLSGFMRRLLLQVLMEDEKIIVSVCSAGSSFLSEDADVLSSESAESLPLASNAGQIFHPRYGSGRSCQCVIMNLNSKCSDVISKIADTLTLSGGCWPDKKDDFKKRTDDSSKKETLGEIDKEVMEFISHSAASAKEKREKSPNKSLPPRPPTRRGRQTVGADSFLESVGNMRMPQTLFRARLQHIALTGKDLPHSLTLSQLLHVLSEYGLLTSALAVQFVVRLRPSVATSFKDSTDETFASDETLLSSVPYPSALKVFASVGGLALLAEHLPLLFPEISRQSGSVEVVSDNNNIADIGHDWVTVESSDELYDPYLEPITPPHTSKPSKHTLAGIVSSVPPHSLIAFGLFLRLPGYADMLLSERRVAQCLLRLVLGVTDDGDGGQILTSPVASTLPTMPFIVLKDLFDTSPLTTDDGVLLRRKALDIGVIHLVLACLANLSHHKHRAPLTSSHHETQLILSAMQSSSAIASLSQPEEKAQQHYWAKGTGFGTGSTNSSWDAEQALLKQKLEEEHVACLLQVLASYINPSGCQDLKQKVTAATSTSESAPTSSTAMQETSKSLIPDSLAELLSKSCLVPALSSYLRNDSVLDMARHVPLYRALLQLLRGVTANLTLVPILLPMEEDNGGQGSSSGESQASIEILLKKMKGCVDTYASRLNSKKGKSGNKTDDEESEGLALLIPDIQETARLVHMAKQRLREISEKSDKDSSEGTEAPSARPRRSLEEQYITAMKALQFDTYEMVTEEGRNLKFNVAHHYESNVKAAGTVTNVARTRRLAQEAVTLSTSLPLAFSSSVFVCCDEERLDIMKVLITGPSDTPYANGCFEFDVFFPQDYPTTPPYINMETTGNHAVRFNPNLYNDGKVCLSVLNTWHGRPEEKWNAQTSSFLQVLVSIQSLILVSEPYFNEPGYERSRGTPSGAASSHEYDANIRQATVKWAMLEQLKNLSPCFKEIIHTHFWLKRHEILLQCEKWIAEMEGYSTDKRTGRSIAQSTLALKRHYNQLREELAKLKAPPDLEVEGESDSSEIDPEAKQYATVAAPEQVAVELPTSIADVGGEMYFPLENSQDLYLDGSSMEAFSLSAHADHHINTVKMPISEEDMQALAGPDC